MKNILVYLLIMLLTPYPASAADVSLNRWVLNVIIHDNGLVEETIQAEIMNGGSLPLDGFSFVVPASGVTMLYDFEHTVSFTGQTVEQQTVPGGTRLVINFNSSVEAGKKWNGRIGFTAENWAKKEGPDYSIDIPIMAPQAIVSGEKIGIAVAEDAEIRSQVFLPKFVEATSIEVQSREPEPYKKLLQFNLIVITWFQLHDGDVIRIKGSFSDILRQIVETNEKSKELSARIKEAKAQGMDVMEAETHLQNVENYNTNLALASFWKKEDSIALEYVGYANEELKQVENMLSFKKEVQTTPEITEQPESERTPGFTAPVLIIILLITFLLGKKK